MRYFILLLSLLSLSVASFAQCEDFVVDTLVYHPTCHGFSDGSISLDMSGGTSPYEVIITDDEGNIWMPPPGGSIFTLAGDECYFIYVEDADGCIYEDTVCLIDPDPIEVELEIINPSAPDICDGAILIDTVYNTCDEGFSCIWAPDPGAVDCDLIDVCPDNYVLVINDNCGCSAVAEAFLPGSLSSLDKNNSTLEKFKVKQQAGILQLSQAADENLYVECYDISGKKITTVQVFAGQQIFEVNMESGLLIYVIRGVDGEVLGNGSVMR